MILKELYVSSFGKIKDYKLNLSNGLNTIKQDNGWGKSTLSYFIKCMFYGVKDKNERIAFLPWNSTERFGGNIVFEWDGKEYKIERFFGSKPSEDTVRIFDNKTGKEFADNKDLGERIFKIDEDGFLSTVFFSQKDVTVKSNTSLTNKFNDSCDVNDSKMYDSAVNKIGEKIKLLKNKAGRGLIPDAKEEAFSLIEKIERSKIAVSTEKTLKEEKIQTENKINEINSELEKMRKDFSLAGRNEAIKLKKERIENLGDEINNITDKIKNAKEVLNGNSVDNQKITALKNCIDDYESNNQKIEILGSDVLSLENDKKLSGKKVLPLCFALFSIVLIASGLIFVFSKTVLGIVFILLAIISLAVCVLLFRFNGKGNVSDTLLVKKKEELRNLNSVKENYVSSFENFFSGFNVVGTYSEKLTVIERALNVKAEAEEKLLSLKKQLDEISNDKDLFVKTDLNENAFDLKKKIEEKERQIKIKTDELSNLKVRINVCETESNLFVELEGRKAELDEKIKKYEDDFNTYNLTLEFLKKADENLKANYRLPLEESLNKYLGYISNEKIDAKIDTDLKVSINEKGFDRDADSFSEGYQNLFDICKRFALSDVLFTAEKPFMILDDPFCNLDDKKLKSALELIKKLQNDYQILYFVCHESRAL